MVLTFPQVTPKNQDPPGPGCPPLVQPVCVVPLAVAIYRHGMVSQPLHTTPPKGWLAEIDWVRQRYWLQFPDIADYSFQILQITVPRYCRLQFPDIPDYMLSRPQLNHNTNSTSTAVGFYKKKTTLKTSSTHTIPNHNSMFSTTKYNQKQKKQ